MKLWASTANYPSGSNPWNGQPTKVAPGYTFVTPGVPVAAQEFNFELNGAYLAAAAGVSVPGASWGPSVNPTGPIGVTTEVLSAAVWSDLSHSWYVAGSDSRTLSGGAFSQVYSATEDGAGTEVSSSRIFVGSTIELVSCQFDGTSVFVAYIDATSHALTILRSISGGAWGTVFTDGTRSWLSATLLLFGGTKITCIGGTTLGPISTSSTDGGATWGGFLGGGAENAKVFTAQNSTTIVAFPSTSGSATYLRTTDPSVGWALLSGTAISGAATGFTWSPADQQFVLTTWTGSQTLVYTSPDGIFWTQVGTLGQFLYKVTATASGCLMAVRLSGFVANVVYSIDAGATWYWTGYKLPQNTSPDFSDDWGTATAGNRLVVWSRAAMRFSAGAGVATPLT